MPLREVTRHTDSFRMERGTEESAWVARFRDTILNRDCASGNRPSQQSQQPTTRSRVTANFKEENTHRTPQSDRYFA